MAGTYSVRVEDYVRGPIRVPSPPPSQVLHDRLVGFILRIESDGMLRTPDELIALAIPALGTGA